MGTWNVGPFDNDAACDLVDDIRAGRFDFIQFRFDCAGDVIVDADDAAVVVALSALGTAHPSELPDGITMDDMRLLRTEESRKWLREQFARVLDKDVSPLYAMWEEADELSEWLAATCAVRPEISLG